MTKELTENEDLIKTGFGKSMVFDKTLRLLYGLLLGFVADGVIQEEEKVALRQWRIDHSNELQSENLRPIFQRIDDAILTDKLTFEEIMGIISVIDDNLRDSSDYRPETLATQVILGVCQGVYADNVITPEELQDLSEWIRSYDDGLMSDPAFIKIKAAVQKAAANYDANAEQELREALFQYVSLPPCDSCDTIEFDQKNFVLSGNFAYGPKKMVAHEIERRGGVIASSVSQQTDFLIVGGEKSILWKYDNYGKKVARACELKEQGFAITILGEGELLRACELDHYWVSPPSLDEN